MMLTFSNTWKWAVLRALSSFVLACFVAAVTIVSLTGGIETVAGGLLIALALIPSIVLFALFEHYAPSRLWKHIGYLVPIGVIVVLVLVYVVIDVAGYLDEESGLPAIALITFVVPASFAYCLLLWKH